MTYQYQYVQSGQSETKDDVLTQKTTWDTGKQGQVNEGGSFGPGGFFPNGTIFTGATLVNFIKFADGCIFVNCTFNYNKKNPYSEFGTGCIFDNCTLNGVTIPKDAVLNKCKIGVASVQSQYINNKGPVKPQNKEITVRNDIDVGTRVTNIDGDITRKPGIHGMSDASVETSGVENLPPAT